MARTTRHTILKLSGAGAVAARTGGLAAILATGRAPAFAQAKTEQTMRGLEVDKNGRRNIMWQAATANPLKETAN